MTALNDLLSKLKRMVVEPKIYAILVTSSRGQILHIGVHFSLEEAYTVARSRMEEFTPHQPGEAIDIELWNTMSARQMLTQIIESTQISLDGKEPKKSNTNKPHSVVDRSSFPQAIMEIMSAADPIEFIEKMGADGIVKVKKFPTKVKAENTVKDHARDVRRRKNALMKKLIDEGDVAQVTKMRDILDSNSQKYVLDAIEKKNHTIKIKKEDNK